MISTNWTSRTVCVLPGVSQCRGRPLVVVPQRSLLSVPVWLTQVSVQAPASQRAAPRPRCRCRNTSRRRRANPAWRRRRSPATPSRPPLRYTSLRRDRYVLPFLCFHTCFSPACRRRPSWTALDRWTSNTRTIPLPRPPWAPGTPGVLSPKRELRGPDQKPAERWTFVPERTEEQLERPVPVSGGVSAVLRR